MTSSPSSRTLTDANQLMSARACVPWRSPRRPASGRSVGIDDGDGAGHTSFMELVARLIGEARARQRRRRHRIAWAIAAAVASATAVIAADSGGAFTPADGGRTHGAVLRAISPAGGPDWIRAFATNGRVGYVRSSELNGPLPSSPAQAVAMDQAPPRVIPVYALDRRTVIGQFVVGGGIVVTRSADGSSTTTTLPSSTTP